MDIIIHQTQSIAGNVRVPADKAISHRAALLCALAEDQTEVTAWPSGDDCQRTLSLVERLGVVVDRLPGGIRIHGVGLTGLRAPQGELDCGESGTTIRLAAGLLAGQPFTSRLTASPSLCRRPMRRIAEPLTRMGARIESHGSPSPRAQDSELYPPLQITGRRPLHALRYVMPVASAQVKSAILLAGLSAEGPVGIVESPPTRDHTERLLRLFGRSVDSQGGEVRLAPSQDPLRSPGRLVIPGDPSSAAFLVVAAAVLPDASLAISDVGLNPTRIQFLSVLQRMGAAIRMTVDPALQGGGEDTQWEPRGTIRVLGSSLRGTTVETHEVPGLIDELPILMVASCAAQGTTVFHGLSELRVKETDRLRSMTTGLRGLGAQITTSEDATVTITGGPLRGGTVESFGDHRTAMSLAIAGLLASGRTRIHGAECVGKSFGEFFDVLALLVGASSVQRD
jgi:3-phosphoshikimate 1-carboxyvinyltransferase